MAKLSAVRRMLEAHGQSHLLQFYNELPADEQDRLLAQIASIDFGALDGLIERHVRNRPPAAPAGEIAPAPVVPLKPADPADADRRRAAGELGRQLLAAGKVAAFVVAGGQGTRLGYDGPKGCLEATPVTHKSLFQVFAEQILAASRRAGRPIPWYIMTSPANDSPTRAFFSRHGYFGLGAENVFFLLQGTMPVIGGSGPDAYSQWAGKCLLAGKGELATGPDGHGGCLKALACSGALEDMAGRGVELISYFQVDNPLARCIDPLFIGLHALAGAEMSAKCLPKRAPDERLGNFCLLDGKVAVIEYSDMPAELACATTSAGRLQFSAGSIAIHVLSRSFVQRLTAGGQAGLPYHRACKKVPFIDAAGQYVSPDEPNAVKLETFIFDALPLAEQTLILETRRREEFSPIKNASGQDSLATSLHDQVRRAAVWLEAAGLAVPRDAFGQVAAAIEISPLYADSAERLKQKVAPDLSIPAAGSVYLGPKG
ncbi:MAG: UDPGP type 1 family protein [Planctomycetota bacterium]|nr:UDPGP type 1 family protein [Planctomycetota bacterium]